MTSDSSAAQPPENIREYVMVLYSRGPEATRRGDEEEVFADHLAFLHRQGELGRNLLSGPFGDDEPMRGISIYDSTSVEDMRRWVANDPAVVNGWFTAEVRQWWGIPGSTLAP